MERTDWHDKGFDDADARFLMLTAITHLRFSSPLWTEDEVRKLQAELAEIDRIARSIELSAQETEGTSSPTQRSRRWILRNQEEPSEFLW